MVLPSEQRESVPKPCEASCKAADGVAHEAPTETLEAMYRTEAGNLAAYFGSRLRGDDEPTDYVHEVFARLARYMAARPILQPHHYLRRIAQNLLFERTRRLRNRPTFRHVPLSPDLEPAVRADQADWLEADDMLKVYKQALGELPAKTREVFLLHRVDELSYREIGESLGLSIPTVQYHVARALAHIDAALGQE